MKSEDLANFNSWKDRAIAILEYHEEQMSIHGSTNIGYKGGWTIRDTANSLKLSPASIVHELRLARTLKSNPDKLALARSRTHALEIVNSDLAIKVELKQAKVPIVGKVIKVIKVDGLDFFYIRLDKTLRTDHIDIETLFLPIHQVKAILNE